MQKNKKVQGSIPAIVRNDLELYEGNLRHYFRIIFLEAQNLRNSYHNLRHILHVFWLCHQGCIYYQKILSPKQMRHLLIASLFHDFDHLGKRGPDSVNIARATNGLKKYIIPGDSSHFSGIAGIIESTEYPHLVPSESLNLLCQILRDADVMQALDTAWIQQVIFGLAAEWGKDPLEILSMQGEFLKNIQLCTEWAHTMFPQSAIDTKIAEANELLDILNRE